MLSRYHPENGLYRKIVLRGDVVVGAILVGEIEKAGVLTALIRQKVDVSQLKRKLMERSFGYAYFVKPMVPATEAFTGVSLPLVPNLHRPLL